MPTALQAGGDSSESPELTKSPDIQDLAGPHRLEGGTRPAWADLPPRPCAFLRGSRAEATLPLVDLGFLPVQSRSPGPAPPESTMLAPRCARHASGPQWEEVAHQEAPRIPRWAQQPES